MASVRQWLRGSPIGAGSFGKVSLAINKDNGELFAVKSIDCCTDRAKAELLAMDNELRILQSLDSPYIVRYLGFDHSIESGIRMRNLFMEYMAGGSLADLTKKFGGRLDESLIRMYTRGVLEGLDYLHSQGVVHCDIKGKNILIGSSSVKIADFGSAMRLGSGEERSGGNFLAEFAVERSSGVGSLKGTPLWMAPEVIMQEEQGPASDIWSLGCTIVEMATGRPPWGKSLSLFASFLRSEDSEELPPVPDCLPLEGKDFLHKCLQRDPKARWTSGQLLKHPFVGKMMRNDSSSGFKAPSSPTSILDFPGESTDWDSESAIANPVPLLHLQRRVSSESRVRTDEGSADRMQPEDARPSNSESRSGRAQNLQAKWGNDKSTPGPSSDSWITVRSRCGEEDRQKPLSSFMLQRLELPAAGVKSAAQRPAKDQADASWRHQIAAYCEGDGVSFTVIAAGCQGGTEQEEDNAGRQQQLAAYAVGSLIFDQWLGKGGGQEGAGSSTAFVLDRADILGMTTEAVNTELKE